VMTTPAEAGARLPNKAIAATANRKRGISPPTQQITPEPSSLIAPRSKLAVTVTA
jgi:hypothetical protein